MNDTEQAQKRDRATQVRWGGAAGQSSPDYGPLDVQFESAFDRACYVLSIPGAAPKNPTKYNGLVDALASQTGCTPEELLGHGEKVRARLWFVLDELKRKGPVKNKTAYLLSATIPAF